MKKFLMSSIAAGIILSLLGAPLAMAQNDQHSQPGPQGSPQGSMHENMHPPAPPHAVVNKTTVQHTTIVHNTTNYNMVQHSYQPHPGPPPPPPHQYVYNSGHQWHHGDYYNAHRYYVSNWQQYHLYQPPQGCQWVQDGGQFVLIAVASGIITDVILNAAYQ